MGVITTFVLRLFVPHEFDMGIKEKLSCPTPQSNRPLAWFLRPIKFRHKLLFKLLSCSWTRKPNYHRIFSFVIAGKMKLLLYQTFLRQLTPFICFC